MKKTIFKILILCLSLALTIGLASCGECDHDYAAADCDSPKTCKTCGATDGAAIGHDPLDDGDCMSAVECSRCGVTILEAEDLHTDTNSDGKCDNSGCQYTSTTMIYTMEDFASAFVFGGRYQLANDIDIGEFCTNSLTSDDITIDLDLNGHKITTSFWAGLYISPNVTLRIKNGTVENPVADNSAIMTYGEIYIENCTLISDGYYTLYVASGSTTVKDSKMVGGIANDANLFLYDTEIVPTYFGESYIAFFAGYDAYALSNVDLSKFIQNDINNVDTDIEYVDGIWIIKGSDFDGDAPEKPEFEEPEFYTPPRSIPE